MRSDSALWSEPGNSSSSPAPVPATPPDRGPELSRRKKKKESGGRQRSGGHPGQDPQLSLAGQILQVLAMAVVAGLVASCGFRSVEWFREHFKPFCDNGSHVEISDDCIPCPDNGFCREGRLECFAGYKKVARLCVEDKEIDKTAEKLAEHLKNRICSQAAQAVCDGTSGAVWLMDNEARAQLKEEGLQEKYGLDETSWLLVWEKMAAAVESSVVTQISIDGHHEFRCPAEVAQKYKPISCKFREWIVANLLVLILTSPLGLVAASWVIKYVNRRKLNSLAEQIYIQVCEELEEKALQSRKAAGGEPWVVVSRLRDHMLLPSERKWPSLWRQVENLVNEDSRIDQYQKKVKGEMKVVWEWQVEGALRTPGRHNKVREPAVHTPSAASHQPQPSDSFLRRSILLS